jgi:hypothetical protein
MEVAQKSHIQISMDWLDLDNKSYGHYCSRCSSLASPAVLVLRAIFFKQTHRWWNSDRPR